MLPFFVRRLVFGALLVFALSFSTFAISKAVPKSLDPACLRLPCVPGGATEEDLRKMDHQLGVDRLIYVQYGEWVWRLVRHASLGNSFFGTPVSTEIKRQLPRTASIVLGGMAVLLLLALPLGLLSALRPHGSLDRIILLVSVFGIALHPFVVGYLLRHVFDNWLGVVDGTGYCPIQGRGFILQHGPPLAGPQPPKFCGGWGDWAAHMALPWLTFAIFFLPIYTRIVRTRILETLDERHVATARAKGASELRVLARHVMRVALLPLIPMVAMDIGGALMAAIYIEISFDIFGIGSVVLNLLEGEHVGFDLPVIAGIFFVIGVLIVVLNLLADMLHYLLEPRVRLASAS
jgi:peptide/nickel transport system permease protein